MSNAAFVISPDDVITKSFLVSCLKAREEAEKNGRAKEFDVDIAALLKKYALPATDKPEGENTARFPENEACSTQITPPS